MDPPKAAGLEDLPNILGWDIGKIQDQPDPQQADAAVRGLAGLIVLGNAWESVDVFHALNAALRTDTLGFARDRDGGRNTLAYYPWLRCRELIDAGKNSMLPDAPKGESLKGMLRRPDFVQGELLLDPAFMKLRAEADADAWHTARTAFMTRRLNEGHHPDTDPSFWNGYTERPAPELPTKSVPDVFEAGQASRLRMALLLVIGVPVLAAGSVAGTLAVRSAKARRRQALLMKHTSAERDGGIR